MNTDPESVVFVPLHLGYDSNSAKIIQIENIFPYVFPIFFLFSVNSYIQIHAIRMRSEVFIQYKTELPDPRSV